MIDKVISVTAEALKVDPSTVEVIKRLEGGMSNYTYVVKVGENKKVVRLPGENADNFVDRKIELANTRMVEPLGITTKTEYFNVETGVKISSYIEGSSLHLLKVFPYEDVAQMLRTIHESKLVAVNQYDHLKRLQTYENHSINLGYVLPKEYLDIKERFLIFFAHFNKMQKVFTHGDSQPSNFIQTYDGKLKIVDFEFTGMNDPFYDLACFGNITMEHALTLLPYYLEKEPSTDDLDRLYFWRAFQCLQWFNVATFKDMSGMSAKLHFDFSVIARQYMEKGAAFLNKIQKKVY
jgi:thiamine kinase-like enzyme